MFAAGSGPIGGSVAQATGTPHWLHYVGTPDIEATIQAAKSRGGSMTKEITAIPNGGKYAVLADPQGAAIAVYQSATDAGKESPPKRGEFSWHELATTDWKAAIDFYSAVFGWEKMASTTWARWAIHALRQHDVQRGGVFNKPPEYPGGPSWLGYIRVKDVNDTVKKARARAPRWSTVRWKCPAASGSRSSSIRMAHVRRAYAGGRSEACGGGAGSPAAQPPRRLQPSRPSPRQPSPRQQPEETCSSTEEESAAKKAPAKKKPTKKKAAKKKAAAKSAKRPARKAAKKGGRKAAKKRSGGKKKAARKARKGK